MEVRALSPCRVDFRQVSDIQIAALQTPEGGDDIEPVRQRIFVPVHVVERAIDLFVIFLAAPIPIFPRLTVNPPRFTMQPGERATSVMAIGLSTLLPCQRAEIPAVAWDKTVSGYRDWTCPVNPRP